MRLCCPIDGIEEAGIERQIRPYRSAGVKGSRSKEIDKSVLTLSEPRRIRDWSHVKFVAQRPCLICARLPSDAHHLRFAQTRALGRKVSDEFTVPLCRGHHREVHHCGDEAAWWLNVGMDPVATARTLWLETHPLPVAITETPFLIASTGFAKVPKDV